MAVSLTIFHRRIARKERKCRAMPSWGHTTLRSIFDFGKPFLRVLFSVYVE